MAPAYQDLPATDRGAFLLHATMHLTQPEMPPPLTLQAFLDVQVPRAGAVPIELGRALPAQTLAEVLDLTLDQTELVLVELTARAHRVGWDVYRTHRDVGARAAPPELHNPAGVDRVLLERAWRRDLARRGTTRSHARMVHTVMARRKLSTMTNDERVQAAAMVNAGILVRVQSGGVDLSPAARYSLLLTQEPPG